MKEQDLIDLGFEKFEENDDVEHPFYYYSYDINGESSNASLISVPSDEVEDDYWFLTAWDINDKFHLDTVEQTKKFISSIEDNLLKEEE